jgi:hypothetical protein
MRPWAHRRAHPPTPHQAMARAHCDEASQNGAASQERHAWVSRGITGHHWVSRGTKCRTSDSSALGATYSGGSEGDDGDRMAVTGKGQRTGHGDTTGLSAGATQGSDTHGGGAATHPSQTAQTEGRTTGGAGTRACDGWGCYAAQSSKTRADTGAGRPWAAPPAPQRLAAQRLRCRRHHDRFRRPATPRPPRGPTRAGAADQGALWASGLFDGQGRAGRESGWDRTGAGVTLTLQTHTHTAARPRLHLHETRRGAVCGWAHHQQTEPPYSAGANHSISL